MEINIDKTNWKKVKFGDVAIQMKGTVDRENTELKYYVKGEHMNSEDVHIREFGELTDEYLGPAFIRHFKDGDILYGSRRTYLKKVAVAHFEGITSNTTFVINANEKVIDKRLLPFLMLSDKFTEHSIMHSKGSVNPYINWKDLANYEFLLPPKEQQAELADLLWAMDEVIEKDLKVLERLEELKILNNKINFHEISSNKIKLGNISKIHSGGTPSTDKIEYWKDGSIPWLTSGELSQKFIKSTNSFITIEGLKNSSAKLVPKNSIQIALAGQGKTKGTVAITEIELCTNQSVATLIANEEKVFPLYLYYNLDSHYNSFRHLTGDKNSRTGLNLYILKDFKISIHELEVQKKIVDKMIQIDDLMFQIDSKLNSSKSLQKSLINQLF